MQDSKAKNVVELFLEQCDIRINGSRAWDIQVHNPKFYERVLSYGSLGLGESYMDGWWDCDVLDQFFEKILENEIDKKVEANQKLILPFIIKSRLFNNQSKSKAYVVGKRHYDIGNNLFLAMLDKGLNYSCGYWKDAQTLDEAQEAKLDLVCRKMNLEPGMKVLDVGCGWGGFAKYASEKYGVSVHGISVSDEQVNFATKLCKDLDVKVELTDYRNLSEKFDRVISIGMFEHVGGKNYRTYFNVIKKCLKKNGLFLLHTIGRNISGGELNTWTNKYIFPYGMIPSAKQITTAYEDIFILENWHSFGQDYDYTLMAWHQNFVKNWDKIKEFYDQRFYRMWTYYLLSSAGGFRARRNQLWQLVFSKNGIIGGYSYT